jgi:hypothetical protein
MDVLKTIATPHVLLTWSLIWGGPVVMALLILSTKSQHDKIRLSLFQSLLLLSESLGAMLVFLASLVGYFILEVIGGKGILPTIMLTVLFLLANIFVAGIPTSFVMTGKKPEADLKKDRKQYLSVALVLLVVLTIIR